MNCLFLWSNFQDKYQSLNKSFSVKTLRNTKCLVFNHINLKFKYSIDLQSQEEYFSNVKILNEFANYSNKIHRLCRTKTSQKGDKYYPFLSPINNFFLQALPHYSISHVS